MKLSDLKMYFKKYPIFTIQELLLLTRTGRHTLETQISNWVKKGEIIQLKKGLYCFNPEVINSHIDKLLIANKLYEPSYISLEYALSHYGLIPDVAYQITSITVKKTKKFDNKFGVFIYRHIRPDLFFGFHQERINKNLILFANKEKALIDYFYLNLKKLNVEMNYLKELRLQNTKQLGYTKLNYYAKKTGEKKIIEIIKLLKKYDELD